MKMLVIYDLCGGTGSWSKPYKENGYEVRLITLPDEDIRLLKKPKENVYGILSAPPCTHFAGSGARWWKQKGNKPLLEGLSVVDACLRFIYVCNPKFWVLENPIGRLNRYIGEPVMYYQPYEYGDAYTKKTCLWGKFNKPKKNIVEPISNSNQRNKISQPVKNGKKVGWNTDECKLLRSITPEGFAKAFYEANK